MANARFSNYKKQTCMRDFFSQLGAPLTNSRWSWGGANNDGEVILRVWLDEFQTHNDSIFASVFGSKAFEGQRSDINGNGARERYDHLHHISSVRDVKVFAVVCARKERVNGNPSEISHYCDTHLIELIKPLRVIELNLYMQIARSIPILDFAGRSGRLNSDVFKQKNDFGIAALAEAQRSTL